jgi:Fe-Mn family superoxide dismutase
MASARDRSGVDKDHTSREFRSGTEPYVELKFDLGKLDGFSEEQVQVHLELYSGYVKNVNTLNGELAELSGKGKAGSPTWSELKRRLGFEYDGMRLHEYYFGNLAAGTGKIADDSRLARALTNGFGSVEAWKKEFTKMSEIRGIGWVITYLDPWTRKLSNHWVTLHEEGHPAGFRPIVVMDMWEHAYMVDWRPSTKAKYVETFFRNLDFEACDRRLENGEPDLSGHGGRRSGN